MLATKQLGVITVNALLKVSTDLRLEGFLLFCMSWQRGERRSGLLSTSPSPSELASGTSGGSQVNTVELGGW